MKRGKDDERMMGPMFPRLHVNDTEKGGPRAPPRNKMALYEQLSIPSQRFNSLNPNNPAAVVPPASSSQGSGHENGMPYQLHQPRSTQPSDKSHGSRSDFNTPLVQLEHKERIDEEDFTVPTFVQSETNHERSKKANGTEEEISPSSPAYLNKSMNIPNTSVKEPKQTGFTGFNLRQEGRSQIKNLKESMALGEQSVKYVNSSKSRENTDGLLKQTDKEYRHRLANNFDRLQSTGASLHHESKTRSQLHNSISGNGCSNEPVRDIKNAHSAIRTRDSCPEKVGSPKNTTNQSGYHDYKTQGPLQTANGERSDDASEISMVDSISALDISPDDVVGIIGQKHFWKARRAIVNQQRVFAVQVFELHRLVKVQRSIAGSPNLLLEDSAYLGKPLKGSPAIKLPLECIVKPSPHIVEHKDDSENQNQNMECSAENGNAVGKTFLSSVQNTNQPSNYGPFSGNPLSAPLIPDSKFSPCFHQSPGHQWLIPVMSPSEGLIYKPYPGNGFMGPVCGGCGPPGQKPMMGSFANPPYGAPTSHEQYPGISHCYFPPYGMPVISGIGIEQTNSFSRQNSGGEVNFNMQHQSSCNVPTQKCGEVQCVEKMLASKETELPGSTASSPPGGRTQGVRVGHTPEARNALPLFPTSPAVNVSEGASQLDDTEQPTRVIRVVPHNARSATESAARIFQSIQQERKQNDSV
ncbi:protein EARLY FLOWERING 3-like [Rhododendron vialii]|uniref:protein EARLY FLOWERING 3-like n=1 Tax=Rhododendron vialii TaxID=182163 RepID=UPI00265EEAD9|nr:protein EARLY FLOWERING 3-like [Rhododendron vialii]